MIPVAIFIFSLIAYQSVESFISKEELNKHGIYAGKYAQSIGFKTGDRITSINGEGFSRYSELLDPAFLLGDKPTIEILRRNERLVIELPDTFIDDFSANPDDFISINEPFTIGAVLNGSTASFIGLEKGDKIIRLAGDTIFSFPQTVAFLKAHAGDSTVISYSRNDQIFSNQLLIPLNGKIGFAAATEVKTSTIQKSFGESIIAGAKRSFQVVFINVKAFKKIFGNEVSETKSLSGPIGVAKIFGDQFYWLKFWNITAMLMMLTAIANFLPFPTSAIWQLTPLLYEKITKKQMSLRTYNKILYVPYILIIGLIVFSFVSDIFEILSAR